MTERLILASGSEIRQRLLRQAGVSFAVAAARIDEPAVRQSFQAEGATPREVADALAAHKAWRVSAQEPEALVIGCDQVLDLAGRVLSKPADMRELRAQLDDLKGRRHVLLSACVICHGGQPLWRHVGVARLHMREASDQYLDEYAARNWDSVRNSVGGYKIEEEGVRLFHRIEGDLFTVMGLPLLELLSWLTSRGTLRG